MESFEIKPASAHKRMWQLIMILIFIAGALILGTVSHFYFSSMTAYFVSIWFLIFIGYFFWVSAFHNSLSYTINADTIKTKKGAIWVRIISIPTPKITNIDISQGPLQKAFGVGNIYVKTSSSNGAKNDLMILGVKDLDNIRNTILERASYEQIKQEVAVEKDSEMLGKIYKEIVKIRDIIKKE